MTTPTPDEIRARPCKYKPCSHTTKFDDGYCYVHRMTMRRGLDKAEAALATRDAEVGALVEALDAAARTAHRLHIYLGQQGQGKPLDESGKPFESCPVKSCRDWGALLANLAPAAVERDQRIAEKAVAKERERIAEAIAKWAPTQVNGMTVGEFRTYAEVVALIGEATR